MSESDGQVPIRFGVLEGMLGFDVDVQFNTGDGSAISELFRYWVSVKAAVCVSVFERVVTILYLILSDSQDYVASTVSSTLSPANRNVTIFVPILGDNQLERMENFFANLVASNLPSSVTLDPSSATINIMDDDRKI